MSLNRTEWRERGYGLCRDLPFGLWQFTTWHWRLTTWPCSLPVVTWSGGFLKPRETMKTAPGALREGPLDFETPKKQHPVIRSATMADTTS